MAEKKSIYNRIREAMTAEGTMPEGFVLREIRRETGALPALADDTPLTVAPPYDELYRHYVEAQIHYCNGETARYNSAAANWNNGLLTYRDYVCRTAAPVQGVRALRLC